MKEQKRKRNSESGMATIEMIPLILLFILLVCYTFGSFGVIHTGIMQSISARSYAFETFRNRANVTYFRDTPGHQNFQFRQIGDRSHAVTTELTGQTSENFPASQRAMAMGREPTSAAGNTQQVHNIGDSGTIYNVAVGTPNTKIQANPVWITVQYGICLNVACGGN